jgi:Protein of unknown function (DUF3237)
MIPFTPTMFEPVASGSYALGFGTLDGATGPHEAIDRRNFLAGRVTKGSGENMIELLPVAEFKVRVDKPIEIGETRLGRRRIIPILGGEASGRISGRILAVGADFQQIASDNCATLHGRYVIETPEGSRIYVENTGLRRGSPEAMARLSRGEEVDPALIYFRTAPVFETSDESYRWLMQHLFVATGRRHPDLVELSIYQVL